MRKERKTTSRTILTLLMIGMLTLAFDIQQVEAADKVNILSHRGWIASNGTYHVSGEVQNMRDSTVRYVKIIATFYDSSNVVIATDFTYTELRILLPGRKSPFEILLTEKTQAAKVHHYKLAMTFSITNPIPAGLEILSYSSYISATGSMHIVGEIENIGTVTATYVKIIATFYDANEKVVATDYTYADPHDIEPGETAPFDILLIHKNRVPLVDSYTLTAQSKQYAIVPELSMPATSSPLSYVVAFSTTTYADPFDVELEFRIKVEISPPSELLSGQSKNMSIYLIKETAVATSTYEPFLPQEKTFYTPLGDSSSIRIATLFEIMYYIKLSNAKVLMEITAEGNGTASPSSLSWSSFEGKTVSVSHTQPTTSQEMLTLKIFSKYNASLSITRATVEGIVIDEITRNVEISGNPSISESVEVFPTRGNLKIYAKDSNGESVSEAIISSISQPSGQSALSGSTDINGCIVFDNIVAGSYMIELAKSGHKTVSKSVTVTAGETKIETITLTSSGATPASRDIDYVLFIVSGAVFFSLVATIVLSRRRTQAYEETKQKSSIAANRD